MWPQPFIIVPFNFGWENLLEGQRYFDTRLAAGRFPWCLVPMHPCTKPLLPHTKQAPETKKILLERSVFELVKNTQFLELTDSKLLSWYLCLPAEDTKLIQEEGGLCQFLQKHPALDVTRNFVYVKPQIVSNEETKKILLERSVFELVKNTQFLELTDSKLLGWYLCLPAEDRKLIQEEGGLLQFLHKHPALDVTRNFLHVKRQSFEEGTQPLSSAMSSDLNKQPTYYDVSLCKNCGARIPFNIRTCQLCCVPTKTQEEKLCLSDQARELGLLPAGVQEELNLCPSGPLGAPGERRTAQGPSDESLNAVTEESFRSACDSSAAEGPPRSQSSQACILSQLWDEEVESKSSAVTVYKDPSAQASFALDAQLERHGKTPQGIAGSQERGRYRREETASFADLETETLPKYCSFDSASYRDCSDPSQSGSSFHSGSDPAAQVDGSADATPCRGEYAEWRRGAEEDSRFGLKNEEFHSMTEEVPPEASCAAWVSSWTPTPQGSDWDLRVGPDLADQSGVLQGEAAGDDWSCLEHDLVRIPSDSSGTDGSLAVLYDSRSVTESPQVSMSQSVDVSGDFRASYTSTRATEVRWSMANKSSNTDPPHATKHAAVNTAGSLPARDRGSQTTSAPTAEKYVITEVYMADLDYFTEEYIKLQHAQDELKELKAKLACSGGEVLDAGSRRDRVCDCSQRAVWAELRLLALQHAMCQQHCWRRYYTSPEGDCSILSMDAPSDNIKDVLQDLEEDYCEMKRKILSGVPLDELRPLSVNSQRISSEALYIPSQMIKDCLSEEEATGAEQGGTQQRAPQDGGEGETGGPVASSSSESVQTEQSDAPPAVQPKPGGDHLVPLQTTLVPQQTASPVGPSVGLPDVHRPGGAKDPDSNEAWYDAEEEIGPALRGQKRSQNEGVEEDGEEGKKDLNCFLCVTGLPSHFTEDEVRSCFRRYQVSEVNITTFSNDLRVATMMAGCARLAEAAGREANGRTVRGNVVTVTRVSPSPAQPGGRAQPSSRPLPRASTEGPDNTASSLSVTAKPLQHRLEKLTNVQATPTASGTCVPQHYGTMGSFDTLMAQLTERHPEAGRERIVQALVELREQNKGLSGLPLKTIVEMTSGLLAHPQSRE